MKKIKQGRESNPRLVAVVAGLVVALLAAAAFLYPPRGGNATQAFIGPQQPPGQEPPPHIQCASPQAAGQYEQGVAAFYLGQTEAAVKFFRECVRLAPECAAAHVGLSRALMKQSEAATGPASTQLRDAAAASNETAEGLLENADDRERRIVYAWANHIKGVQTPSIEKGVQAFEKERSVLDYALALYPEDVELWALRGDAAESPVRAAPFYLTVLRLQPDHPLSQVWKPTVPPAPVLNGVKAGRAVNAPSPAPRLFEGLGKLEHKITTSNPKAQAFYEQGLRLFHAYVSPSRVKNGAAQCFAYAAALDPKAAMPYWGLSFCLSNKDSIKPMEAAQNAYILAMQNGTDKEKRMCAARVLELMGKPQRVAFLEALDGAIAAWPDDIELWVWRGKVYGDYGTDEHTLAEKVLGGMAYELAANRRAPEHPSPNHELIHAYEAIDRPALGWDYSVAFQASAPNLPHANHMQAHLAMRLGRWDNALSCTRQSWHMARQGFPELDPGHHLWVLLMALAHEGRFAEAEKALAGARAHVSWVRMMRLKADEAGKVNWIQQYRQKPTPDAVYVSALLNLDRGNTAEVKKLMPVLETLRRKRALNAYSYNEVLARYMIASGQVEQGMQLFKRTAEKSISDGSLHFFGGGGYFPEAWGEEALRLNRLDDAELAFHEALAHEHGSVVAALGMQVVWERRGDLEMASHYAARAADIWKNADPGALQRLLFRMRSLGGVAEAKKP